MSFEVARDLVAAGFFMLLVFLRLEADRFGTAEYEKPLRKPVDVLNWLSWYGIGAVLIGAVYTIHPNPRQQLFLALGHGWESIAFGLPLGALGVAQAIAYARYRYGYLRLPPTRGYPRAAINAVGTAMVDEAVFRGVVLGALLAVGLPTGLSIVMATVVYLLATRLAAPGRRHLMLVPATFYGLAGGWATVATGGLGAALILHAITAFALFLMTGHAGQPEVRGREPEELAALRRAPEGWRAAEGAATSNGGRAPDGERLVEPTPSAGVAALRESIGRALHRAGHA